MKILYLHFVFPFLCNAMKDLTGLTDLEGPNQESNSSWLHHLHASPIKTFWNDFSLNACNLIKRTAVLYSISENSLFMLHPDNHAFDLLLKVLGCTCFLKILDNEMTSLIFNL